jgi:uncharacterized phage protein (TIGR02218 family)
MSFVATEISNASGQPAVLFEFQRDNVVWRYAALDVDVVVGSDTYAAETISCDEIVQSGDSLQDEFKIIVPMTLPVVLSYLNSAPTGTLAVRVRRQHFGISAAPVVWVGTLDRVRAVSDASAELICTNALASLESGGLRLAWTRTCTHMLFDAECKASRDTFKRVATVSGIAGLVVTAAGLAGAPVGVLRGGYLEWTTAEGYVERQTIIADNNGSVTLLAAANGLTSGMSVTAFFGCPRSAQACSDIFNNLANFGGFPHLPQKSPFDGTPVF